MQSIGIGSYTSTGGEVVEGNPGLNFNGRVASSVGQKATCPKCKKGWGYIVAVGPRDTHLPAGPAARSGDIIDCGCPEGDNYLLPEGNIYIGGQSVSPITHESLHTNNSQPATNTQATQSKAVEIPAGSGYWPPYDFSKREHLNVKYVEYTQQAVDLAVLSVDEAQEFVHNLWQKQNVKDTLGDGKKVWDLGTNINDAYQLAKGLGGLGVIAYVKQANGKDYVIIKNYKRHLKTLVKGHRWRANNPQVVQLGLGSKNMARQLLSVGLVVDIAFSVAVNAVDVFLNDEKTMVDLVGQSGADIVKGFIATGVGTVVAVALASAGVPLLAAGLVFALVGYFVSQALDEIDNELGVSKTLVTKLKETVE